MSYDQRDAPIAQICTDWCYAGKLIYAGERRQCVADLFNEGRCHALPRVDGSVPRQERIRTYSSQSQQRQPNNNQLENIEAQVDDLRKLFEKIAHGLSPLRQRRLIVSDPADCFREFVGLPNFRPDLLCCFFSLLQQRVEKLW
jgi:hypothetical protein